MPWVSSNWDVHWDFYFLMVLAGGCLFIAAGRRGCSEKHHALDAAWPPQLVCRERQHGHPTSLDPADVPRGPCWETTVGIVRNSLCSKSPC